MTHKLILQLMIFKAALPTDFVALLRYDVTHNAAFSSGRNGTALLAQMTKSTAGLVG